MSSHDTFVTFAEDVAAQAIGTVIGAGLVYVGAASLGMLRHEQVHTVITVLVISLLPLIALVALPRRRHGRRPAASAAELVSAAEAVRMAADAMSTAMSTAMPTATSTVPGRVPGTMAPAPTPGPTSLLDPPGGAR